jgi:hypothetical protein
MSIADDIEATTTQAELTALYQAQHIPMKALRSSLNDDRSELNALSEAISVKESSLNAYGKIGDVKRLFWVRLGELHKGELNGG